MVIRKPTFNCYSTSSLIFRIILNFVLQRACHIGGHLGFDQNPMDNNLYIQSWHILIGPSNDFFEFLHQSYKLIFHVLGKVYSDLDGFFYLDFLS